MAQELNAPECLGEVEVTAEASHRVELSETDWTSIWPRHTKALIPGKSTLSLIDLPKTGQLLAIATDRTHKFTFVASAEEWGEEMKSET